MTTRSAVSAALDANLALMRADAILPADIQPATATAPAEAHTILLTGATGFVGAYLLHTLLHETAAVVLCLVRPQRGRGAADPDRVSSNLRRHGLWQPEWAERVRMLPGDLRRPGLGWSEHRHAQLAESVDAIYHGAATVNWILPYSGVRAANVLGTRELLRLACRARAKPFHFLSTLGVCFATGVGQSLTEADDPWPLVDRLHLGYAESKSVADQLVRQARERGLPGVICRPTLITGDSRTGAANPQDILARAIGACVQMGCAPDVDWSIEACPVDHVARAVVRCALANECSGHAVLHLLHPRPRPWRELVLWMRLRGYPMVLVPYRDWLRRLERTASGPAHPLHAMLGFFRTRVGGMTLPETYMGGQRSGVSDGATQVRLASLGVHCATLGADWLERFFASLTAQGVVAPLTEVAPATGGSHNRSPCADDANAHDQLALILRHYFDDPLLEVCAAGPAERLAQQSILTELTSWRCGSALGLFRVPLVLHSRRPHVPTSLSVVAKVKTDDRHLLDVVQAAAELCDHRVGSAVGRWRDRLGFMHGHLREIALCRQTDERRRRLTPIAYGSAWDADGRRGILVLEDLTGRVWMDDCTGAQRWQPAQIEAAIDGLAELHAVGFERQAELSAQPWLGTVLTARRMGEMGELWSALAAHAARFFGPWLGPDLLRLQRRLLARIEHWWLPLEQLPHTLIHNDFNPRNLALRPTSAGPRLCAYDWELATWGLPQHDLAQFLCFVLPFDCTRADAEHFLDLHRRALEKATQHPFERDQWRRGFAAALADLLINRWALYALVHAIRHQPFLERVLHTWRTLIACFDPL